MDGGAFFANGFSYLNSVGLAALALQHTGQRLQCLYPVDEPDLHAPEVAAAELRHRAEVQPSDLVLRRLLAVGELHRVVCPRQRHFVQSLNDALTGRLCSHSFDHIPSAAVPGSPAFLSFLRGLHRFRPPFVFTRSRPPPFCCTFPCVKRSKVFIFFAFSHFNEIFTVKISNDLPVNSSHSQKNHILPL